MKKYTQLEIPVMNNDLKPKTIHLSKFHLMKLTIRAAELGISPKLHIEQIILNYLKSKE
jgi:hypothetical protein